MNTIFKRTLTTMLALLMAAGVLFSAVSCAETEDDSQDTSASTEQEKDTTAETEAETGRNAYGSMEKEDFKGKTFTICNRKEVEKDMYIEKITNDLLDDAIYERNKTVAEDFGIKFAYVTKGDYGEVNEEIKRQSTSNLDEFDIFIGHKFSFAQCAQQNHCYNLNNISTLNLDEEWWDQACYDNLTIDGKTHLMVGDIHPTSMRISSCYVFNKTLMRNLQMSVEDLFALTKEGKWTLDKLIEYTAGVTASIDGKDGIDYQGDRFGLVSWKMDSPFALYYGAGQPFVTMDEDGLPTLTYYESSEQVVNIYDKLYKLIIDQQSYFITDEAKYETCYDVFADGRSLFCDITLHKISSMIVARDMADEYGILPVPKYDEAQTEYRSFVNGASPFTMVCRTEKDAEFVGTVLEAMATFNYDKVTPNMFEIVTKLQAANDPDSSAMVDLIIRNRIYDVAYFYDWTISNMILNGLETKTASIASEIKKNNTYTSMRVLPDFIEAFEKME